MSLKKAIAVSCDTLWYQIAYDEWVRDGGLRPKSSPNDYFFKAAQSFQITQKVGIDLPSESTSRLADRTYKKSWYQQNKDFYCNYKERATKAQQTPFLLQLAAENCVDGDKIRAGDAVNFSIGQGDTVVTPLKLLQMYAAIGNGGTIWQAKIAKAIVKTDGTVIKTFAPNKLGTLAAAPSTIKFLQGALREVVISGTGAGVFAGFPIEVSGKTGTAQVFGRNPNGSQKDDTSWFASYAPSKNPRYAVVMMVGQGGFGASTSGVGVRQIYSTLFGVTGNKVVPGAALFPEGKPPTQLPKISPATKPKEATK
jgi:penicillin-binding protein 2